MRHGLKFDGVAVAGIGMVRFGMLQRLPDRAPGARRRARSRCTTPGMTLADVDEAFVGYIQPTSMIGIKAMKELGLTGLPGHPHRERVGHRARRLPRGGVGGVVGPGRRRDGAVLRQVHRHGGHRRARRRSRRDRRADPARRRTSRCGRSAACTSAAPRPSTSPRSRPRTGTTAPRARSPHRRSGPRRHGRRRCSRRGMVAEPLTAMMCCPADDGAACVILAREDIVRSRQPGSPARAPARVGAAVGDATRRATRSSGRSSGRRR